MLKIVHPVAGLLALLTIATFWLSTVLSELFGSETTIVAVKSAIPWGFLILIPSLAAAGGSGFAWSKGQRQGLVGAKARRMPLIAANGILVLVPSALFLAARARAGDFDMAFYTVQGIELLAGATNLALLGLQMRDGMRLSAWRRRSFLKPGTTYRTTLLGQDEIASGTIAFRFKKPDGFTYRAGQAIYLTLPGLKTKDGKGRVRTFSLVSAPHDPDLVIATRMTDSAFKRALADMPAGRTVEIEGPYGDLTLHEDSTRPAVFLAGGMGITPFLSMIRDAVHRDLPHRIVLLYSNRDPAGAAFLDELAALESEHPRLNVVATMTGPDPSRAEWHGERGPLTRDMIARHVGDMRAVVFYLAGPPAMVAAMTQLLKDAGVKDADLRAEAFLGY